MKDLNTTVNELLSENNSIKKELNPKESLVKCNIFLVDEIFKEELDLITDIELRNSVLNFLVEKVPLYFYEIPASSSGKYHPSFDQGTAGLVRHTRMCVAIANELFHMEKYFFTAEEKNIIIASLILHDSFKNRHIDTGHTVYSHQSIAADEFYNWAMRNKEKGIYLSNEARNCRIYLKEIPNCIAGHMGQWSRTPATSAIEEFTHLCDYIASRKFFDKFNDLDIIPYTNNKE